MIPVRDEALYVGPPASCHAGAGALRCVFCLRLLLGGASARAFSTDADDEACAQRPVRHALRARRPRYLLVILVLVLLGDRVEAFVTLARR